MAAQNSSNQFQVKKRDGRVVDFDKERIASGIFKAAESVGGDDRERAEEMADMVEKRLKDKYSKKGVVHQNRSVMRLNKFFLMKDMVKPLLLSHCLSI